jgi:hypothetical protein
MSAVPVNVENFVRAETDRMLAAISEDAGGAGRWLHHREPIPLDHQTVVRMNRDTLYSAVVADISGGATLSVPDAQGRYLSVMVVNQDHYINRVFHEPGEHELTMAEFDTPFVLVAARILVDPNDPEDVRAVNGLQDRFGLAVNANTPFTMPDYDADTFTATRNALEGLAKGIGGLDRTFGRRENVDPVRHLLGTAAGWGGLPESEAYYIIVNPDLPVGEYVLTVRDVPVDGFWSISLYNAEGFFPNTGQTVSINNLTAMRGPDGSVTVYFGSPPDRPNSLPTPDGWNYTVRLYRPRAEVLDGTWTFPEIAHAT